jgi:hypothetical protein
MRVRTGEVVFRSASAPTPMAAARPAAMISGEMVPAFDASSNYLFVSGTEPVGAAAALWDWPYRPPGLCVTSPTRQARATGAFACAGYFVPTIDEPMLAPRGPGESADDFAARFAEALRIVYAFAAQSVLVVCDRFPSGWEAPFCLDEEGLLRRAETIEHALTLP